MKYEVRSQQIKKVFIANKNVGQKRVMFRTNIYFFVGNVLFCYN